MGQQGSALEGPLHKLALSCVKTSTEAQLEHSLSFGRFLLPLMQLSYGVVKTFWLLIKYGVMTD